MVLECPLMEKMPVLMPLTVTLKAKNRIALCSSLVPQLVRFHRFRALLVASLHSTGGHSSWRGHRASFLPRKQHSESREDVFEVLHQRFTLGVGLEVCAPPQQDLARLYFAPGCCDVQRRLALFIEHAEIEARALELQENIEHSGLTILGQHEELCAFLLLQEAKVRSQAKITIRGLILTWGESSS
jgi:hypothetical protein